MQLRYNYRLYPSPGQRVALARAFGCARVVFNDALRARQDAYAAARSAHPIGEVTIIGPGAGPQLAGQGVLSDIIAVTRWQARSP